MSEKRVYNLEEALGTSSAVLQIGDRHFLLKPLVMDDVERLRDAPSEQLHKILGPFLKARSVKLGEDGDWSEDGASVTPAWLKRNVSLPGMLQLVEYLICGHRAPKAPDPN